MNYTLEKNWSEKLSSRFTQEYKKELFSWLEKEYATKTIFPPKEKVFNALNLVPVNDVKVVIIGQDPYHEPGQAHGLSFSVEEGVNLPPSLQNIYKEINSDLGVPISKSGNLTCWAKQGVLLLNTVLTVRRGQANSHQNKGWETFTSKIIELLNNRETPIVFMLWGNSAKKIGEKITNTNHFILKSAHPSPLSAYNGFFGCKHFSKANEFLKNKGFNEIDWKVC